MKLKLLSEDLPISFFRTGVFTSYHSHILNETSVHATNQAAERIWSAAAANPELIPDPDATYKLAIKNAEAAEKIYKGPDTYVVELLPRFDVLLHSQGFFPIPKNKREARTLPDFRDPRVCKKYGSIGNVLVATLVPPLMGDDSRAADQLKSATFKFQRDPSIPLVASKPHADKATIQRGGSDKIIYITYDQLQNDIATASGTPRTDIPATASDILHQDHPEHEEFLKWLGNAEPTKRKARKYLASKKEL